MNDLISSRLTNQAGVAQQSFRRRFTPTEGAEHLPRVLAAPQTQHRVPVTLAQGADGRFVLQANCFKGGEGIRTQHLGPFISIISGVISFCK